MSPIIKDTITGLGLSVLFAVSAQADGVYGMYTADSFFIDDIEIVGDMTMPTGETFAVLEMRNEFLRFYVDPDAIYVTLVEDNPIIVQKTPFNGFWVSTQSVDTDAWPSCSTKVFDESGAAYKAHGTLVWTNTAIAANGYELAFEVDLGTCDAIPDDWAFSSTAVELLVPTADNGNQTALNEIFPSDIVIQVGPQALAGVAIGTPASEAVAALEAAFGPGDDSGWIEGCPFNGVQERFLNWGGLTATFEENSVLGGVFLNWSYGLNYDTGAADPWGPSFSQIVLPNGMQIGGQFADAVYAYNSEPYLDETFGIGIYTHDYFMMLTADDDLNGPIAQVAVPFLSFCE